MKTSRKSVSERFSVSDELCEIGMYDAISLLDQGIQCKKVLWIVILDSLQGTIFPFLGRCIGKYVHRNLYIGVVQRGVTHYEVNLKLADFPNTDFVSNASCVLIYDVLKYRAIWYAVVCVVEEIETQIR